MLLRGAVVVKWSARSPSISDDPSSSPADAYRFSVNFVFEKNDNKQKEAGVVLFKKQNKYLEWIVPTREIVGRMVVSATEKIINAKAIKPLEILSIHNHYHRDISIINEILTKRPC